MTSRRASLVQHPSPDVAYQALRFCRTNGARVDVFYVADVPGGPFSAPTALRRSARQHGWRCAYRLWCAERRSELSIDHLVPLVRGGTDRLHNLRIVCADCNERKGDMKLQSFRSLVRQRVYERRRSGQMAPTAGGMPTSGPSSGQDRGRVSLIELAEHIARIDHVLQTGRPDVGSRSRIVGPTLTGFCMAGAVGFLLGAITGRKSERGMVSRRKQARRRASRARCDYPGVS